MPTEYSGVFALPFLFSEARRAREAAAQREQLAGAFSADRAEGLRQAGIRPEGLSPFSPNPGAPSYGDVAAAVQQHPAQPPLERIVADAEAKRPAPQMRLRQFLDPAMFAHPDFPAMFEAAYGKPETLSPGQVQVQGGQVVAENAPLAQTRAPGQQSVDPRTGEMLAETPYKPVVVGQGGSLMSLGTPSAPEAKQIGYNPETFAPDAGGAGGTGRKGAMIPQSVLDGNIQAEMGLVTNGGMLYERGAGGQLALASPETVRRYQERRRRAAEEQRGIAPSIATATQSSAPQVKRDATDAEARAALQAAGGDVAKAAQLLESQGLNP